MTGRPPPPPPPSPAPTSETIGLRPDGYGQWRLPDWAFALSMILLAGGVAATLFLSVLWSPRFDRPPPLPAECPGSITASLTSSDTVTTRRS